MELHKIAARCIFAFLFLLAITRLSGNRTPGQGTLFDFVLALILGDMIDDCLWAEVPASQFVIGAGTLVVIHLLVEMGGAASERFSRFVGGGETLFMRDGKLIRGALRRERMSEREVEWMLRRAGLARENWNRIERAWIEPDGRPGVILHEWAQSARAEDLKRERQ